MEIEKDPKFQRFLINIQASPATQIAYVGMMTRFCNLVGKTPSELIEEGIKEVKAGLMPSERKIADYVATFRIYLNEKGFAPKSQSLAMAVLKSFYKNYDMPLSESISKIRHIDCLQENKGFIKKEDVKALITNAKSLRERAIIFTMATSGMAMQEIVNLRMKNITLASDEADVTTIRMRRQKSNTDFFTFISPEATKALKDYFDERNRDDFTKITSPEDFVFVANTHNADRAGQLSTLTLSKLIKIMGRQLGYENGSGFVKTRSHALRKFFASTLENAGFPKHKVDYMMGHTVSKQDEAYFEQSIPALKELYKLHLPHLTFEHEITVRSLNTDDAKKLSELEKENAYLKSQIQDDRIDRLEMNRRLEAMEKLYQDLFNKKMNEHMNINQPNPDEIAYLEQQKKRGLKPAFSV